MAASFSCDGCGSPVDDPAKVGHVLKRDYCPDCKVKAEEFMAAEEQLRLETQRTFLEARSFLISQQSLNLLPDVPDA